MPNLFLMVHQKMWGCFGSETRELEMPSPETELLPGVRWGRFEHFFTPAYWYSQAWLDAETQELASYRLGSTLREEATACILGGYGIPAEVGLAAFEVIRKEVLLENSLVSFDDIYAVLSKPLTLNGKSVRYRFSKQKASYLPAVLNSLLQDQPSCDNPIAFRNFFLQFKGIGPKTASWITRNWLDSSDVAILDVHIQRAGCFCGLFRVDHCVQRQYFEMERLFLAFSSALGLPSAILDALIWRTMKVVGKVARNAPSNRKFRQEPKDTPYLPLVNI